MRNRGDAYKTCTKCKTLNNDNANFCRVCGTLFPGTEGKCKSIDKQLVDKINELQNKMVQNEETIKSKKKEIGKLKKKIGSLDSQISTLSPQVTTLQNQCKRLRDYALTIIG